jgi:hypothetical protein
MTGGLLVVLGACVVLMSSISLLGYSEPKPSYFGMAVLLAALLIMPCWRGRSDDYPPSRGVPHVGAVRLARSS